MTSLGRSLSTRVPKKQAPSDISSSSRSTQWVGPSNVTTFLRVLHLLDLDLLNDWPGINESIFSSRVSQQNLQQRIRSTEWSLYRLFELWDPVGTQDKLRPFFPPLAPLQSKNLRAALFRSLSDLKRDGVLGKEVNLRKTMLDECKGEKFEEVLASFSMAALRRFGRRQVRQEGRAGELALHSSSGMSLSDQELLVPMILSYHHELQQLNRTNSVIRRNNEAEINAIQEKESSLRMASGALATQRQHLTTVPKAEREEAAQNADSLTECWDGDLRWIQEILGSAKKMVQSADDSQELVGTNGLPQRPQPSLLRDLESRVVVHQDRLRGWKTFQRTLESKKKTSSRPAVKPSVRSAALPMFTRHQSLNVPSMLEADPTATEVVSGGPSVYRELSESLEQEISAVRKGQRYQKDATPSHKQLDGSDGPRAISKPKPLAVSAMPSANIGAKSGVPMNFFSPVKAIGAATQLSSKDASENKQVVAGGANLAMPPRITMMNGKRNSHLSESLTPTEHPNHTGESQTFPNPLSVTPDQQQSHMVFDGPEQIDTTTISPFADSTSNEKSPDRTNPKLHSSELLISSPTPQLDRHQSDQTPQSKPPVRLPIETLLERTRQSMSLLPNPQSSNTHSMNISKQRSRPSTRPSTIPLHPINQFDTPPANKHHQIAVLSPTDESIPRSTPTALSPFASTGLPRSPDPSSSRSPPTSYFPSTSPSSPPLPISSPTLPPHIHHHQDFSPPTSVSQLNPPSQSTPKPKRSTYDPDPPIANPLKLPTPDTLPEPRNHEPSDLPLPTPTTNLRKVTPQPDLFSPAAEYQSVFKSRPKIRHSPSTSPERSRVGVGDETWI